MKKIFMIIGLATILCTSVFSAKPANAWSLKNWWWHLASPDIQDALFNFSMNYIHDQEEATKQPPYVPMD